MTGVPATPDALRTILRMALDGDLGRRQLGRYEQAAHDAAIDDDLVDEDGGITELGRRVYTILGGRL